MPSFDRPPIIDISPLVEGGPAQRLTVSAALGEACRTWGFFYATGHGVSHQTLQNLESASRAFFALPEVEKLTIAMPRAGRAWRGYFPLGGELTSGRPDQKEGIYFGESHSDDHPRVKAAIPLHGRNLYPESLPALRPAVEAYMREGTAAADVILQGLAQALGFPAQYFRETYTREPTILFRIFHYPAVEHPELSWGVGEHTDYGLLTLLATDATPGLQVKSPRGWIDAPPIPGALICNIGDMLDRLTNGWFKSTPHRVRNVSGRSRLSFPLFVDPNWDAIVQPLPIANGSSQKHTRWDGADLSAFNGTYGDYLLAKVGKVFPDLAEDIAR